MFTWEITQDRPLRSEYVYVMGVERLGTNSSIIKKVLGPMFDTELLQYCIVDYDSKWSIKFHKDCMFEIFVISLLRRLMIIYYFLFKSIKAHVQYRTFTTLQIELYHVVHYDSKCSTKFHKDCMFEIFVISLLRRLMIIF